MYFFFTLHEIRRFFPLDHYAMRFTLEISKERIKYVFGHDSIPISDNVDVVWSFGWSSFVKNCPCLNFPFGYLVTLV